MDLWLKSQTADRDPALANLVMKQSLKITAATSASSAEQPTSPGADQHGDGASAGQPALQLGSTNAVQPALQLGTSSAVRPATEQSFAPVFP